MDFQFTVYSGNGYYQVSTCVQHIMEMSTVTYLDEVGSYPKLSICYCCVLCSYHVCFLGKVCLVQLSHLPIKKCCVPVWISFGVLNTCDKRKVWRQACSGFVMFDAVNTVADLEI